VSLDRPQDSAVPFSAYSSWPSDVRGGSFNFFFKLALKTRELFLVVERSRLARFGKVPDRMEKNYLRPFFPKGTAIAYDNHVIIALENICSWRDHL
jgi:hypothetical protein